MNKTIREIFSTNLTKLIEKNNITKNELARNLNVSSATVSDWCNKKQFPRDNKIEEIANFFKIDVSILLSQSQEKSTGGGIKCINFNNIFYYFNFIMNDDSMNPIIMKNDKLTVLKTENIKNNDIIIFINEKNKLLCRKYLKNDENSLLLAINSNFNPIYVNKQIKILGKVIKLKRFFNE